MTEFESNDTITAPTTEPPNILFWRIGSVVSVAIVLLVALIQSFSAQPLQYRSLFWLMAAAVLLPIAIRFVFPVSWQALFRNPDLLIPFGIAWVVSKALAWLTLLPLLGGLLSTGWNGAVFGLSLSGSIFSIFYMLVLGRICKLANRIDLAMGPA